MENNTQKEINLTKSEIVTEYYKLLKYSKFCIFNETDEKFNILNNILEYSKTYLINKRRFSQTLSSNENVVSNNNIYNNKRKAEKDEISMEFDLMKGKLSIEYDHPLAEKNLLPDDFEFIKIEILDPLCIVLEPTAKMGLYIGISIQKKFYDDIMDTDIIKKKLDKELGLKEEEEEEDDEDDTKVIAKISGKAEVSCAASAGIVLGDNGFTFAILAGINGLLGKGEIGFGLIFNFSEKDIGIDKFWEVEAFYISCFLKIEVIIELAMVKFKFNIYILNYPIFGLKYGKHDIIYLKIFVKMLIEEFVNNNKNQLY